MPVANFRAGNPGSLCVTRDITRVNYREHEAKFGSENLLENGIEINEAYHVASSCGP